MTQQKKNRILYIAHCYNNRGGVEEHTKALERGLGEEFEVHVAYPEDDRLYLKTPQGIKAFDADPPKWPITPYNLPATEKALEQILKESQPDLIHIQHFLNWHLGLFDQVLAYGRPIALSFHEYYAITPHFTMEGVSDTMEGVSDVRETLTLDYSQRIFGGDVTEYLIQRREMLVQSLSKIETQIVPSKFLALELAKAFPREYRVIPHGIAPFIAEKTEKGSALRFVYLGSLIPQKGWEYLVEGFELAHAKNPEMELHLYGGGDSSKFSSAKDVHFHPIYEQEELPSILGNADVGVIPSTFRETFSYVLSEMWQAGLPVIASDIGALAERIRSAGGGGLFKPGNAATVAEALLTVSRQPEWLAQKIPTPRTLDEMLEEYRALYRILIHE